MANFKNLSRYSAKVIDTNRSCVNFLTLRNNLIIEEQEGDAFVEITAEYLKRPELLSSKAYGIPDLWWAIYEVNEIRDPLFELTVGQILIIPDLDNLLEVISRLQNTRNRTN